MACTANFLGTAFLGKIRLLIGFVVSLSLHLIAFALLVAFIPANDVFTGRLTALPKASFVVTLANPEKSSRLTVSPSVQGTRNANEVTQNARKGGASPFLHTLQRERYFLTSDLDVIPKIQRDIDLQPSELRNFKHGGGKVVLRLWIDETGRVAKVEPVISDMPAIFSEVASRVFMQANFLPGRKNDLAVKSKVEAVLLYPNNGSLDLGANNLIGKES